MIIGAICSLLLPYISALFLEKDLLQSVERAMRCTHRVPPPEPVIAMTPKKYSQLIAVMRKNLDTPLCNKNRPISVFDIEDTETWNFCVIGICEYSECHCNRPYIGHTCAVYNGKCWMMYCFLSGCHPEHQVLTCKCDPQLYGARVLTGDYWYEDGKQNIFAYPPPSWNDDILVSSSNIAYKKGQSRKRVKVLGAQNPDVYSPIVVGSIDMYGNIKGDMGQSEWSRISKVQGKGKNIHSGSQYKGQSSGSMGEKNQGYDIPVVIESFDKFGNRLSGMGQNELRKTPKLEGKGKKTQSGRQHKGQNSGSAGKKDQEFDVPVVIESFDKFGNRQSGMGVPKAPQLKVSQFVKSSEKIPNGRKQGRPKLQKEDSRNNPHLNRQESISENDRMFQRGQSQRMPMGESANEKADPQNYMTALKPDRADDTTEDLKEALEEVEMESSSVINDRKSFYFVIFLNFLIFFFSFQ